MRHLRSIIYALVLAPAVWILCGVGFDQNLTGRARDNGGIESLSGVLLLLLAGAAYAILLFSPISPAGPLLAGLVFAGVGAWARIAPDSYAGVWPADVAKDGFDVSTPGYGLAVLLAVPLLCTALSARRWRGYEPPQILLIGTIGRARGAARVAGTPMASERTSVIPQQRQAPPPQYRMPAADTTQIVAPAEPTMALPPARPEEPTTVVPVRDDGDEKTTVMRLGGPAQAAPVPTAPRGNEEPTVAAAMPPQDKPAQAVPPTDAPTHDVTADRTTRIMAADQTARLGSADQTTRPVAAEETTRLVAADESTSAVAAAETTREVTGEEATTRLVLPTRNAMADPPGEENREPAADSAPQPSDAEEKTVAADVAADGDERTQVLRLPVATDGEQTQVIGASRPDERTQVLGGGTVEPPGDRTQLLTIPAPGAATTVAASAGPRTVETTVATSAGEQTAENTKPMSIVGEERPDPGEDPTTLLTVPRQGPGEATTQAKRDRLGMTVTNLERPADEAADDTQLLTPPAPTEDDTTRRL